MSEVEELANKYFEEQCEHTYADTLEELKEDVVTAFLQGYAKGETDEKFRTKQVVTKDMAELTKENEELKKNLSGIVYMVESGLHVKNQLAFERCITEAKLLLRKGEIK